MTIVAGLGFTLFGMIAGALLLARWWIRTMFDPKRIGEFLHGLGENLRKQQGSLECPDHGCPICGPSNGRCPVCGMRGTTREEDELIALMNLLAGSLTDSQLSSLGETCSPQQMVQLRRAREICTPREVVS